MVAETIPGHMLLAIIARRDVFKVVVQRIDVINRDHWLLTVTQECFKASTGVQHAISHFSIKCLV